MVGSIKDSKRLKDGSGACGGRGGGHQKAAVVGANAGW